MITTIDVSGTQSTKPPTLEVNGRTVYIRSGVRTEQTDDGPVWRYTEHQLTVCELDSLRSSTDLVPDGQWDEGLHEVARTLRHEATDGLRASLERAVRLGDQTAAAKLRQLDEYNVAVSRTKGAPGYPSARPSFPDPPQI